MTRPSATPKPKFQRRAEARPDEILDAALAVFTTKGFDAARVDDIAAQAKLSKGAVYLYFDSKEALLRGLIEREVAPVAQRLKALAEATGDPARTLKTLINTASRLIEDPRIFATPKTVFSIAPRFPEIAEFYRSRVIDEAMGAIATLHRRGVKSGAFRDTQSETVARMVMGPIFMQAMRKHIFRANDKASPEERARAHVEILFDGLLKK